jgi:hypothetical protein
MASALEMLKKLQAEKAKQAVADPLLQTALQAIEERNDQPEVDMTGVPVCLTKNGATIGYVLVSAQDLMEGDVTACIFILKGSKPKEVVADQIEGFGVSADIMKDERTLKKQA